MLRGQIHAGVCRGYVAISALTWSWAGCLRPPVSGNGSFFRSQKLRRILYVQPCYVLDESQTISTDFRIEAVKESARRRDNDDTFVFIATSWTVAAKLVAALFEREFQ